MMLRRTVAALCGTMALIAAGTARGHCFDGSRDGTETDVDCGGACQPCGYAEACITWRDCITGLCVAGTCNERPYEGGPVPPGYAVELSDHDAPATARKTGIVFFAVGYSVAYVGALSVPTDNAVLFVPIYGPWSMAARDEQKNPGLLVVDGIVQTVGALLLVGGWASAGKQLLRTNTDTTSFSVTPLRVGADGYGAGLSASF